MLGILNKEAEIQVHTDASMYGFGAILHPKDWESQLHPIHFMSKETTKVQKKYRSYELEVLAIVEAIKNSDHIYLV